MSSSFFWYDLETSGTDPKWDRIVQFAGVRTDADLNQIGEGVCFYVHLADEVLPDADATLVTGITPAITRAEGVSEWEALTRINALFSVPETCVVGYNSLRFDDEFVRYGLYRTLNDPYAREWQNGNSRWDILDLVRATGALRRRGIEWPVDEDGLPVYRLEILTQANQLEHANAHDALSDVYATIGMARLIKTHQPKLFDYAFAGRAKKQPRSLLEPIGERLLVHVSGMYPRERYGFATIVSVARHPTNNNSIIVADLSGDVEMLVDGTEDEIREALFAPDSPNRPPLKEVRLNRSPFIAPMSVLTRENRERLGVDEHMLSQRMSLLKKPGLAKKLQKVYAREHPLGSDDVDAGLYGGFLKDEDRTRCVGFNEELKQNRWVDLDYSDPRLHELSRRLKGRSFAHLLSAEEQAHHAEFVASRLYADEAPWRTLDTVRSRITALLEDDLSAEQQTLIASLAEHVADLEKRYPRGSI
jgi:exodeoxyribonuclease-1